MHANMNTSIQSIHSANATLHTIFEHQDAWSLSKLQVSNDAQPLATTLTTLLVDGFPYDRLPSDPYVAFFFKPECVAAVLLFYLVSKPIMKSIPIKPKSTVFRMAVAAHNLSLAIFSAIVAYNVISIVIQHTSKHGMLDSYCDRRGMLWHDSGLGTWVVLFYLSKFYEFIDTWILVWKNKRPSFLQMYHHVGVVFCMWISLLSQSNWLVISVVLNSVIHSAMYTYFFVKTVSPKTDIKAAKYLTAAQICQFIMGITYPLYGFFMMDNCDTSLARFAMLLCMAYVSGLIGLFSLFARRKYKKD